MRFARAFWLWPNLSSPSMTCERCRDRSSNAAAKALRPEIRDRFLHVGDRHAPLRHFGLEIRDVALVPPALRVEIELRAGPHGGERKGWRLDLLARPIRIDLFARLSERRRGEWGHNRNRESGADRSMHLRFLLSAR
jgi:hypothetical protein